MPPKSTYPKPNYNAGAQDRENLARSKLLINSEHKLRSENLPFDIDVWYPLLKDFTFPTHFIPLSRKEAISIVNMYQTMCLGRDWLTIDDVLTLEALEKKIDQMLKKHFHGKAAFLRLCGRSPKDADPIDPAQVLEAYHRKLEDLIHQGYPDNANTAFVAFSKIQWMKVTSAADALNLLVTSERVHTDMDDWLRYGEPEQIVLREWAPDLDLQFEFRAFVHQNRLNAISQYDHYGIFPGLDQWQEKVCCSPPLRIDATQIQTKIFALWAQAHPLVGEASYAMDFAFIPERDEVHVIEISPFLECTGPACFRWSNSDDKKTLMHGPFEFRLNKESKVTSGLIKAGITDRFQSRPTYANWLSYIKEEHTTLQDTRRSQMRWWVTIGALCSACLRYVTPTPLPMAISIVLTAAPLLYLLTKRLIRRAPPKYLLFCYGTLKRGMHWNCKYLSRASFQFEASTKDPYPLIFGACGVPYMINRPGTGQQVVGEVWEVDQETLDGLDEYEGLRKGYYTRAPVYILQKGTSLMHVAHVYFKQSIPPDLHQLQFHNEYTLADHKRLYQPIRHIQVKQRLYLGIEYDISS